MSLPLPDFLFHAFISSLIGLFVHPFIYSLVYLLNHHLVRSCHALSVIIDKCLRVPLPLPKIYL